MIFKVDGKPQGKARARTFYDNRARKMRSVTPEQTRSYEDLIRWRYTEAGGEYLDEKLVRVKIIAFYPIPKSFTKKQKEEAMTGGLRPTTKPDCDNIIKVVLDALNGVAYYDDKQVVEVSCEKYYSKTGYLHIAVEEAPEGNKFDKIEP